jgi:hypothetical protein
LATAIVEKERKPSRLWLARIKHLPLSDGTWSYSRRVRDEDPRQGWKLHVSATILSAAEVFARAEPILRRSDALFKVLCRLDLLRSLNSGLGDFSQIGKFLTIYPRSTGEALELARALHRATRGLAGPRVPFDAQYRRESLVYYRYGAFRPWIDGTSGFIHPPRGRRYRDQRAPKRAIPRWLEDPFQKSRAGDSKKRGLFLREFLVFKAKAQRGKGGVYDALDLSVLPVRRVIIKEGRRHGETNWDGKDGYALVEHEARVLRKLRAADLPVPKVLREFTQNRHRYLVLERIQGRPFLAEKQIPRQNLPGAGRDSEHLRRCSQMHALADRAIATVAFLFIAAVRFIDFEGACRKGQTESAMGSPITFWRCRKISRRPELEDDYALGGILHLALGNSSRRSSSPGSTL